MPVVALVGTQAFLGIAAHGHVARVADGADHAVIGAERRNFRGLEPAPLAAGLDRFLDLARQKPSRHGQIVGAVAGTRIGREEVQVLVPDQRRRVRVTGQQRHGAVDGDEAAVSILHPHRNGKLSSSARVRLLVERGLLGLLALSDVAGDAEHAEQLAVAGVQRRLGGLDQAAPPSG